MDLIAPRTCCLLVLLLMAHTFGSSARADTEVADRAVKSSSQAQEDRAAELSTLATVEEVSSAEEGRLISKIIGLARRGRRRLFQGDLPSRNAANDFSSSRRFK
ncbi:uncharacterized protein LOC144118853 [Amblyomma americanum]